MNYLNIGVLFLAMGMETNCDETVVSYLNLFNEFCKIWKDRTVNFVLPEILGKENDEFYHLISAPSPIKHCKQRLMFVGMLQNVSSSVVQGSYVTFLYVSNEEEVTQKVMKSVDLFNNQIWLMPEEFLKVGTIRLLKLTSEMYGYKYEGLEDSISITETYSIQSKNNKSIAFGDFTQDTGLNIANTCKWERRRNLTGVNIVTGGLEWKPMLEPILNEDGQLSHFSGIFPMLFEQLRKELDFQIEWILPPDGKWGAQEVEGHWNGLVGLLERKEIDLIGAPMAVILERSLVMDYSFLTLSETYSLISQNSNKTTAPNVWGYLIIFTMEAWLLIIACLMFIATSCLLKHRLLVEPTPIVSRDTTLSFVYSISLVLVTLIQMEYPFCIRRLSSKLLYFTLCMFACIIFVYYSADLTARLTVFPSSTSIESFNDAYDLDYSVAILGGSISEVIMASGRNGSGIKKMWEDKVKPNPRLFAVSMEELIAHIMASEKNLVYSEILSFEGDSRQV